MGDPRNPARRYETWDSDKVSIMEQQIRDLVLGQAVAVSGGWAWHFMSPEHTEYKLLHDHKDVDILADPEYVGEFVEKLQSKDYEKVWTKYDRLSSGRFYRYEKHVFKNEQYIKVQIDLFLEKVPYIIAAGNRVVEPTTLLGFYDKKQHTTDDCVAVKAARELVKKGISPLGHPELIKFP
jgi:hypothetical protein